MPPLAVLVKAFAVVPGDDDERARPVPLLPQAIEKAPEFVVGVGDLPRVGAVREAGRIRERRAVLPVRRVEMDPEKAPLSLVRGPESNPEIHGLARRPLVHGVAPFRGAAREEVLVGVEPLGEAEPPRHGKRGSDGSRREPGVPEDLGEGLVRGSENVDSVVADPGPIGIKPGEHGGVAGGRHGGRGDGVLEEGGVGGEAVEGVRLGVLRAVDPDVVGPGRVECDEEDVARHGVAGAARGGGRSEQDRGRGSPQRTTSCMKRAKRGSSRRFRRSGSLWMWLTRRIPACHALRR